MLKRYKLVFSTNLSMEEVIEEAKGPVVKDEDGEPFFSPLLSDLEDGDCAICSNSGMVIERSGDRYNLLGIDLNFLDLTKQLQEARSYKENTAFKIIERTAKADVWSRAACHLRNNLNNLDGSIPPKVKVLVDFMELKAKGHYEYLNTQPTHYDYSTQSFIPKNNL